MSIQTYSELDKIDADIDPIDQVAQTIDIGPTDPANQELSQKVLKLYYDLLSESSIYSKLSDFVILGSYGRLDGQNSSDMDTWLILPSTEDLKVLREVAVSELQIRQGMSRQLGLPNLASHLPSLFDPLEASLFREVYAVRVGIPYGLGEHKNLRPQEMPRIEHKDLAVDWIVTMEEFFQRDNDAISKGVTDMKWKRRIIQEYYSYFYDKRPKTKADMDNLYYQVTQNSNTFEEQIKQKINFLKTEYSITDVDLNKLKNMQTVATTLEKIRWEFITCLGTPGRYENWLNEKDNIGEQKRFAFTPNKILEVIDNHYKLFNDSIPYPKDLIDKINNKNSNGERDLDIQEFYSLFRVWCLDTLKHNYYLR